jgi:hypothetical protein
MQSDEACPKCGTPRNYRAERSTVAGNQVGSKSKTAAVLLAVFLSYWTWLYTFKTDKWKFFVGLGLFVILYVPPLFFQAGFFLANLFSILSVLALLGVSVWAIIDTAIKPSSFYSGYRK